MSEKIVLKNVRLSYEHIFHADAIGDSEPKYSASWIIPKEHTQVKSVKGAPPSGSRSRSWTPARR